MSSNFRVGDVCLTFRTEYPGCNDGILVFIMAINPAMRSFKGDPVPFLIRCVDGGPFVNTSEQHDGSQRWAKDFGAWAAGYKLKRVDDCQNLPEGVTRQKLEEVQS